MGNQTYRKTYESGAWFEIQSMANIIIGRESRGEDASYCWHLLECWKKYPGYELAGDVIKALSSTLRAGQHPNSKALQVLRDRVTEILHPTIYETTEETPATRGAPRKEENLSRTTLWRRAKEAAAI